MNNWFARGGKATNTLIGVNALVFLADYASGGHISGMLALNASDWVSMPWTLVTYGFAHADILHIIFNLYSLWIFGEVLERALGTNRFLLLYLGSVVAGGIAFIATSAGYVVGASGGIYGLMAAYFVIMRAMGYRSSQMLVLILINIFFSFTSSGIALAAHLGGLAAGAAIAWVYTQKRN